MEKCWLHFLFCGVSNSRFQLTKLEKTMANYFDRPEYSGSALLSIYHNTRVSEITRGDLSVSMQNAIGGKRLGYHQLGRVSHAWDW